MSNDEGIEELRRRIIRSPSYSIDKKKCGRVDFLAWIDCDYRPRQFARVQREFIDRYMPKLGLPEIRVYLVLCQMANKRRGICWPSVHYLSERLGVSERHIRRSTRKLQQEGLIQKGRIHDRKSNRQHNIYKIALLGPGGTWEEETETGWTLEEIREAIF